MESNLSIKAYHVKHKQSLGNLLHRAKQVADYAVKNKSNKKILTSKYVKHFGLPSDVSNQILRKYGRGTIKEATNVNLIVPSHVTKRKLKDGSIKQYSNIDYHNGTVTLKPLKMTFKWNPGRSFEKINQVEINEGRFMISATFKNITEHQEYPLNNVLGLDHNCGVGRHIINAANLQTGEVINLGKCGPNDRKMYFKKRQKQIIKGHKEKRKMKDLDHKISRTIVNYALKHRLRIVVENLQGIRNSARKGKGSKTKNRFLNSWSFYRLQQFIEYKSKEHGIPFEKINPHYTSQECSYCSIIGQRDKETFICNNKRCCKYNVKRHADVNAAFNVGKRSLQPGGRAP